MTIIALFGTDGTGKSTQAKLIKNFLTTNFKLETKHWRPCFFFNKSKNEISDFSKPDNYRLRSKFISVLYSLFYFIDFYSWLTIQKIKNDDCIIIYERFFYDILIHPSRYKLRPSRIINKFLAHLLIRPKYMIYFYGRPNEILNRKNELTINEIERQQMLMNYLFPKLHNNLLKIDVTDNDEDSVFDKIKEYLDFE